MNHDKRSSIFNRYVFPTFGESRPDIFAFQETYLTDKHVASVHASLPGKVYMADGVSGSRGVLLGFNPRLDVEVQETVIDKDGRYIVAKVLIQKESLTIVTVYIEPTIARDKHLELMTDISDLVAQFENSRVIYCGDFNMVLDPHLDTNTKTHHTAVRTSTFQSFLDLNELTDVWRVQHPTDRRYTCFTNNQYLSRLDMFLCSPEMLTYVTSTDIGLAFQSDHSPITMQFSLHEDDRGRGFWRLPNYLLGVTDYVKTISELIKDSTERNSEVDDDLLWDTVQANIRGESIRFQCTLKREKKQRIENIESEIASAVQERDSHSDDKDMITHYTSKVNFLQIELNDVYIAANAKQRAFNEARKYFQNERSSKYYFRLPGKKYDSIKRLVTPQGHLVTDTSQILDRCVDRYSKLYTQEPNRNIDETMLQELFLQYSPYERMTYNHQQLLDKPITEMELYKALCTMKNDKAPGCLGLTVEFYRAFWPQISKLVHNSIMCALKKGGTVNYTEKRYITSCS